MTAQIIQFSLAKLKRPGARAKKPAPAMPVLEGVIVSEAPPDAPPTGCDLALPVANRFAHVAWKRPRKPAARKPKASAKMRSEQCDVACVRVPRRQHRDLQCDGVLTLDWKGDVPWTITFDPDNEDVPNLVAPVETFSLKDDDLMEITTDEGVWAFAPMAIDNGEDDGPDEDDE